MDNQRVVDFVQSGIVKGLSLQQVCEDLLDTCLAPEAYVGGVGTKNVDNTKMHITCYILLYFHV